MRLVNDARGYGIVTRFWHWLTVALVAIQFVLGYGMESLAEAWYEEDTSGGSGGDRLRAGDDQLVFAHAWIGGAIVTVVIVRLLWRWVTPLPEWSQRLSELDRQIESRVEQVLYVTLFVIPLSGIALLYFSGEERELTDRREWLPPFDVVGGDLALGLHIAGHVTFYVALAVHVGLAIRRRTVTRML